MIRFTCQTCGARIRVGDDKAGKSGKCPRCRAGVRVPPASVAEALAPAPAGAPSGGRDGAAEALERMWADAGAPSQETLPTGPDALGELMRRLDACQPNEADNLQVVLWAKEIGRLLAATGEIAADLMARPTPGEHVAAAGEMIDSLARNVGRDRPYIRILRAMHDSAKDVIARLT